MATVEVQVTVATPCIAVTQVAVTQASVDGPIVANLSLTPAIGEGAARARLR